MKKLIYLASLLLLGAFLLTACPGESCDHVYDERGVCTLCGNEADYVFVINDSLDGYIIAGTGPAFRGGDVKLPSKHNGLPVDEIGDRAFLSTKNAITSLTVPKSIKKIGYKAFSEQKSLTSVDLGDGVKSVGGAAFYNCTALAEVRCGDALREILSDAFGGCESLSSVDLGDGVRRIHDGAFARTSSLKSLVIPSSVTLIGYNVFEESGIADLYFGVSAPGEKWDEDWAECLADCRIHWNN